MSQKEDLLKFIEALKEMQGMCTKMEEDFKNTVEFYKTMGGKLCKQ